MNMSLMPDFELGLLNSWIFSIWLLILPMISGFIIKDKKVSKKLRISAPMKFEKFMNILSMSAVLFVFIFSIFLPIKYNNLWFYFGVGIFFIAIVLDFSILTTIRTSTVDKPFTKGPYKYSRHPIYISTTLILISVTIISLSWVILVLLAIVLVHLLLAVPSEERYCQEKYGDAYCEYLEKTPRWIGLPKK